MRALFTDTLTLGTGIQKRGGSWFTPPLNCRSAQRNRNSPGNRNNNIGFQVVSVLAQHSHRSELVEGILSSVQLGVQTCSGEGASLPKITQSPVSLVGSPKSCLDSTHFGFAILDVGLIDW
ncbi:MAG: hypothetical protein AAF327_18495 [Cyanobacteria bacterium P01_A01_bin.37]